MSAPEPVAWMVDGVEHREPFCVRFAGQAQAWERDGATITPLYAGPFREEWGWRSEAGSIEPCSDVIAQFRRLVGPWEEVPRG